MKKSLILICLFWAACQGYAQNVGCGFDTLRQITKANDVNQQLQENLFQYRLNRFRDSNNINILATPMAPSGNGNNLVAASSCFAANYIIPVIVHVVYEPLHTAYGYKSHLNKNFVMEQIKLLNQQFANYNNTTQGSVNTGIQFCLAPVGDSSNGIMWSSSSLTNTNPYEASLMKGLVNENLYPGGAHWNRTFA